MRYGQFCPVAKAAEVLGNTWTLLIIRELLVGNSRFTKLQQAMPRISPTVLNTRLKELEAAGVITKRAISGQRGHSYQLTPAGKELVPVIESLVVWGMRWAREDLADDDLDVALLMLDVERNLVTDALPGGETVLQFRFSDLEEYDKWWIVCDGDQCDLCDQDPGKDVSAYITSSLRDLVGVWMGDIPLRAALESDRLMIVGEAAVCKGFRKWFPLSSAAAIPRPSEAQQVANTPG